MGIMCADPQRTQFRQAWIYRKIFKWMLRVKTVNLKTETRSYTCSLITLLWATCAVMAFGLPGVICLCASVIVNGACDVRPPVGLLSATYKRHQCSLRSEVDDKQEQ